jgi:hypothetical protein
MPDKQFPQAVEAYESLLKGLKDRIRTAQVKAYLAGESRTNWSILVNWQRYFDPRVGTRMGSQSSR